MSTQRRLELKPGDELFCSAYVLASFNSTRTETEVRAERAQKAAMRDAVAAGKLVILATRRKP